MYNNGNSSKNVTGASVVDGTLENADYADNGLSGDKIDGGIISNFQSTGIDDRLPTGKILTLSTTGADIDGSVTCDSFTSTGIDDNATSTKITIADDAIGIGTAVPYAYATTLIPAVNPTTAIDSRIQLKVGEASKNAAYYCAMGYVLHATHGYSGSIQAVSGGAASKLLLNEMGGDVIIGSGNVDIASFSSAGASVGMNLNPKTNAMEVSTSANVGGGQYHYKFYNSNGFVGNILTNGSATSFNTSSDYRLKENVVSMAGSIDRLKALKPSRFNFIADADTTVDGFLAHEAQEVVPECATGTKDAMMTEEYEVTPAVMDGETVVTEAVMGEREVEDYQSIDQSKLVPLLVSALQEAIARIETLENA
jgi:hypothetical protein